MGPGVSTRNHTEHLQTTFLDLLDSHAGSGFEQAIAGKMRSVLSRYTSDIQTDTVGNVIARVSGESFAPVDAGASASTRRPRVMLSAHMDEISLIVTSIEPGGHLHVWDLYGFDARALVGQEVLVHGDTPLLGIVGSKPPHLSTPEERKQAVPIEDLYIDLAMPESMVRDHVRIGDRLTLRRQTLELQNGRIASKAVDNRASLAVVLECLEALRQLRHTADVYAVATVQEEVRMHGAKTAAYGVAPDIAIAIDVTFGSLPGQAPEDSFELGSGPVITMGPNIHPKVFRALRDTANRQTIPFQIEVSQGPTGTDAAALQIAREGIATGLVGVAIRYMHTSVETVSYNDIVLCGRLLAHYIAGVDMEEVEGLSCY